MSAEKTDESAGGEAGMEAGPLADNSMGAIISSVFNDIFSNIVHDMVLEAHREEKILRMRSAAILAEDAAAAQQMAISSTPQKENPTPTSASAGSTHFAGKLETAGASYDNGHITLKGNPLKTTKDIICPRCRYIQLQHPTSGEGARAPPDPAQKYCKLHPFVTKPGHDIWANPFPSDNAKNAKLKKELKENAAKQAEQASANGSIDTPAGSPRPSHDIKLPRVTSYPYVKCNSCGRHIQVNRFAKHLDGCMGITGRQSSRNAIIKMSASNGTPNGSRTGTPLPGSKQSPQKRDTEDADSDDSSIASTVTPQKKASASRPSLPKKKTQPSKPSSSIPISSLSADPKRKPPKPSKLKESNIAAPSSSPSISSPLKPPPKPSPPKKQTTDTKPSSTTTIPAPPPSAASPSSPHPPLPLVVIKKPPPSNGLLVKKQLKRQNDGSPSKRDGSPNGVINGKSPGVKRKREEGGAEKEGKKQKRLEGKVGSVGA
ncbi:MAG: hypothetical protein M1814_001379 [Vezdaea aestivalis]|nr:MAG: hypothetical protein M1814_001379 [Vezdaea aestivalis]